MISNIQHAARNLTRMIWHAPRNLLIMLVTAYQHTLSPDHGPLRAFFPYGYCKFTPTCSQYMKESLRQYGAILGLLLGGWRILRCNPCSKGNRMAGHVGQETNRQRIE